MNGIPQNRGDINFRDIVLSGPAVNPTGLLLPPFAENTLVHCPPHAVLQRSVGQAPFPLRSQLAYGGGTSNNRWYPNTSIALRQAAQPSSTVYHPVLTYCQSPTNNNQLLVQPPNNAQQPRGTAVHSVVQMNPYFVDTSTSSQPRYCFQLQQQVQAHPVQQPPQPGRPVHKERRKSYSSQSYGFNGARKTEKNNTFNCLDSTSAEKNCLKRAYSTGHKSNQNSDDSIQTSQQSFAGLVSPSSNNLFDVRANWLANQPLGNIHLTMGLQAAAVLSQNKRATSDDLCHKPQSATHVPSIPKPSSFARSERKSASPPNNANVSSDSSTNFNFSDEAEKMVNSLCSSETSNCSLDIIGQDDPIPQARVSVNEDIVVRSVKHEVEMASSALTDPLTCDTGFPALPCSVTGTVHANGCGGSPPDCLPNCALSPKQMLQNIAEALDSELGSKLLDLQLSPTSSSLDGADSSNGTKKQPHTFYSVDQTHKRKRCDNPMVKSASCQTDLSDTALCHLCSATVEKHNDSLNVDTNGVDINSDCDTCDLLEFVSNGWRESVENDDLDTKCPHLTKQVVAFLKMSHSWSKYHTSSFIQHGVIFGTCDERPPWFQNLKQFENNAITFVQEMTKYFLKVQRDLLPMINQTGKTEGNSANHTSNTSSNLQLNFQIEETHQSIQSSSGSMSINNNVPDSVFRGVDTQPPSGHLRIPRMTELKNDMNSVFFTHTSPGPSNRNQHTHIPNTGSSVYQNCSNPLISRPTDQCSSGGNLVNHNPSPAWRQQRSSVVQAECATSCHKTVGHAFSRRRNIRCYSQRESTSYNLTPQGSCNSPSLHSSKSDTSCNTFAKVDDVMDSGRIDSLVSNVQHSQCSNEKNFNIQVSCTEQSLIQTGNGSRGSLDQTHRSLEHFQASVSSKTGTYSRDTCQSIPYNPYSGTNVASQTNVHRISNTSPNIPSQTSNTRVISSVKSLETYGQLPFAAAAEALGDVTVPLQNVKILKRKDVDVNGSRSTNQLHPQDSSTIFNKTLEKVRIPVLGCKGFDFSDKPPEISKSGPIAACDDSSDDHVYIRPGGCYKVPEKKCSLKGSSNHPSRADVGSMPNTMNRSMFQYPPPRINNQEPYLTRNFASDVPAGGIIPNSDGAKIVSETNAIVSEEKEKLWKKACATISSVLDPGNKLPSSRSRVPSNNRTRRNVPKTVERNDKGSFTTCDKVLNCPPLITENRVKRKSNSETTDQWLMKISSPPNSKIQPTKRVVPLINECSTPVEVDRDCGSNSGSQEVSPRHPPNKPDSPPAVDTVSGEKNKQSNQSGTAKEGKKTQEQQRIVRNRKKGRGGNNRSTSLSGLSTKRKWGSKKTNFSNSVYNASESEEEAQQAEDVGRSLRRRRSKLTNKAGWSVWQVTDRRKGLSQLAVDTLEKMLNTLWNMDESDDFKHNVSRDTAPDYYLVVKNPMTLEEIAKKLKGRIYENLSQCIHDFRRLFYNCKLYNEGDSEYVRLCEILEDKFNSMLEETFGFTFTHIRGDPVELAKLPELTYSQFSFNTQLRHKAQQQQQQQAASGSSSPLGEETNAATDDKTVA